MKTILLVVAFVIAVPALGQEVKHAPTVDQCQADQRLWLSKLEGPESGLDDAPFSTLNAWNAELDQCKAVDPQNHFKYYNTTSEITAEQFIRAQHFIDRHGLHDQFIAEDTAGKR